MTQLVEYSFPCVGSRTYSTFNDTTGNDALGSLDTTDASLRCSDYGVGITPANPQHNSPLLRSTESLQGLKKQLAENSTALTISLWITPDPTPSNEEDEHRPILTIGKYKPQGDIYDLCNGYNLRLMQVSNTKLAFKYREDHSKWNKPKCDGGNFFDLDAESFGLTQVTISIGRREGEADEKFGFLRVYVNGTNIFDDYIHRNKFNGKMSSWDSRNHLELFTPNQSNNVFAGSLHRLAIYDHAPSDREVQDSYLNELEELDYLATRVQSSTVTADAYLPAVEGLPSKLFAEGNRKADVTFLSGEPIQAQLFINGTSDLSPSDANGWWVLKAKIVSVPKYGILTYDNNTRLHKNDLLDMERIPKDKVYTVPVQYRFYDPKYFNVPESTQHPSESFEYRISLIDATNGKEFGWSSTIKQSIFVVEPNQPTTIHASNAFFEWNGDKAHLQGNFTIADHGFQVENDLLRVDVRSTYGKISLSGLTPGQLPKNCTNQSRWQCYQGNKRLIFLANNATQIADNLQSLEYTNYTGNDTVTIIIFDGKDESCWREVDHHHGLDNICHNSTVVIPVPANTIPSNSSSADSEIGWHAVWINPIVKGTPSLLAALIVIVLGGYFWRRCMTQGTNAGEDEDQGETKADQGETKDDTCIIEAVIPVGSQDAAEEERDCEAQIQE